MRPRPPVRRGPNIRLEKDDDEHSVSVVACPRLLAFAQQHLSAKFNKAYLPLHFDASAVIHCAAAYCGRLCEQYELAHVESASLQN